ncbi:MAG TPA: condensation domain-containing protein [Solirubrobacteraceae bacterium]|nr:condensation domain-containing protein [Solirubrobacteraceae bacterium]
MPSSVTPSITSLPLSLLDELYLNLDRAAEPWTVQYELHLSQRLDAGRLAGAITSAADRHPLSRARLASWRYQDHGYHWVIADELETASMKVVECGDERRLAEERERLFERSPSLDAAPPFILVLARRPDGDSLLLNLHHAAGDGISAARLMLSILRAYLGEDDPVPALDALAVHDVRRLSAARSADEHESRRRALLRGASRSFVPIARVARDGGDGRPAYGFELMTFTPEESRALFARHPPGGTVNDVLLAALAVTISRWNAEHGRSDRPIALTMPVNLRPPEWRSEILSNFASWVTVWIRPLPEEDLSAVIERVGASTRTLKRERLGGLAVDLLELSGKLMIAAKRWLQYLKPLTGDIVVDTASLSNLGRLEALPPPFDGAVTAVGFSPPGQMPLGVSIGVVTLGDRLHVTLRYRRAQFNPPAARRFTGLYRDVLLS